MAPTKRPAAERQLAEDIRRLRDKVEHHRRRIVIEDGWGRRYDLDRVLAIEGNTADPGIVLKIRQRPDHPNS